MTAAAKETAVDDGENKPNSINNRLRVAVDGDKRNGIRRKKRRIRISLSEKEIEEDLYALTGARPSRRPKKWPENIQKHLDSIFPGLDLVEITAESEDWNSEQ